MKTLWLDPVGGLAGDMLCAALIDLGADLDQVRTGLQALSIEGLKVDTEPCQRGPFAALRFHVECTAQSPHHRPWADIRALIAGADLPERARDRALAVFSCLAQAEASVHGTEVDEVHFHEVGAWDSIADIVGGCLALESLGVEQIVSSAPPLSTGSIQTAHGDMPLPAPATLALLDGWPVREGPAGQECTTPTGAAFLAALATPSAMPTMRVLGTGTGAGSRDPSDRANVVRAVLGEATAPPDQLLEIKAQMDDLSGEHLPPLIDALIAAGAVDAYATQVIMKKGRSGLLVTALAPASARPAVADAMLRHGSTFGVRWTTADRSVLDRWHETVQTPHGEVRLKIGALDGTVLHASPEYEDVRAVATASGQPVPVVHAAAIHAWKAAQESG